MCSQKKYESAALLEALTPKTCRRCRLGVGISLAFKTYVVCNSTPNKTIKKTYVEEWWKRRGLRKANGRVKL